MHREGSWSRATYLLLPNRLSRVRSAPPRTAHAPLPALRGRASVRSLLLDGANREPLRVFLLTRLLFLLLTYFGVILFQSGLIHTAHPFAVAMRMAHPSTTHALLPAWNQWDTRWYIDIANRGYTWKNAAGTSPAAFFPLYPMLIHALTAVTHRSGVAAALLISNAAFLSALLYLWRLVRWELNPAVASRTILCIAAFPTALFFFAGYTESLFLFLTVAAFYHMRRRDWLLAGIFAALASATRVTGVLLLVPLVYEYARDRNFSIRNLDWGAIGLLIAPLGLVAFMVYLGQTVGDPLAFSHAQTAWQKTFTLQIWSGFLNSFRQLIVLPHASYMEAHNVIEVTLGGLALIGSVLAARRLPAAYGLYLLAFWLVTLTSPAIEGGYPVPLISLSRYVLSLFPFFIWLGVRTESRAMEETYLVLSVGMMALLTVQFLNGGWVI